MTRRADVSPSAGRRAVVNPNAISIDHLHSKRRPTNNQWNLGQAAKKLSGGAGRVAISLYITAESIRKQYLYVDDRYRLWQLVILRFSSEWINVFNEDSGYC